jgi:hypothetical protein
MLFQQLNRSDAEKVFISVRNTSGDTLSAGVPVFFEHDAVTDGNAVSQASATEQFCLFAGITDASIEDDAYGLAQVYGYRQSAYVSACSAGSEVGLALIPVAGQDYLTDSTSSGRFDWNFVNLMETVGASAGYSGVRNWNVFIRAL